MIEELDEKKVVQQEPKKVEDIIKRYLDSQQELMVLRKGFLTS
jgi:hypothetical protein